MPPPHAPCNVVYKLGKNPKTKIQKNLGYARSASLQGFNWDGPGPFFPVGLELGSAAKQFPQSSKWGNDTSQAVFTSWTNGWYGTFVTSRL